MSRRSIAHKRNPPIHLGKKVNTGTGSTQSFPNRKNFSDPEWGDHSRDFGIQQQSKQQNPQRKAV